jgi:hypothetical protein
MIQIVKTILGSIRCLHDAVEYKGIRVRTQPIIVGAHIPIRCLETLNTAYLNARVVRIGLPSRKGRLEICLPKIKPAGGTDRSTAE